LRRLSLLIALSTALAGIPALAGGAPGVPRLPGAVRSARLVSERAQVVAYWTKARMKAAIPAEAKIRRGETPASSTDEGGAPETQEGSQPSEPLPWNSEAHPYTHGEVAAAYTSYPYSTHGKVFFRDPSTGYNYVCSGTAAASANRSVVWTAGHCLHGGGSNGKWMTNWVFVPAYRDGDKPLGMWTATQLFAPSGWVEKGDFGFDLGAAVVAPNGNGVPLADVAGTRGIAFNQLVAQLYVAYGYPAASPFTGGRLHYCQGVGNSDPYYKGSGPKPIAIGCNMTGGSSGGGWVNDGGVLLSVNSFGYQGVPDVMHGPYQATAASTLHATAEAVSVPVAATPSPDPTPPAPSPPPTPEPTPTFMPEPEPEPTPTTAPEPEPTPTPTPTPSPSPSPTPTVSPSPTPPPVDNRAPALSGVRARPTSFSPDGDGRKDKTRLFFSIDENAYVTVKVVRDGKVVRTLGRKAFTPSGDYFVTWNGKTNRGKKAATGKYVFRIRAVDEAANPSTSPRAKVALQR
jgi:hypothetical protein